MVRYGVLGSDMLISYRIEAYKKAGLIVSRSGTSSAASIYDEAFYHTRSGALVQFELHRLSITTQTNPYATPICRHRLLVWAARAARFPDG